MIRFVFYGFLKDFLLLFWIGSNNHSEHPFNVGRCIRSESTFLFVFILENLNQPMQSFDHAVISTSSFGNCECFFPFHFYKSRFFKHDVPQVFCSCCRTKIWKVIDLLKYIIKLSPIRSLGSYFKQAQLVIFHLRMRSFIFLKI